MTVPSVLRILVADLLDQVGARRAVALEVRGAGIGAGDVSVAPDAPIALDLVAERVPEGVVVRGTVAAPWTAACARCLAPAAGRVEVHVDELFEAAPEPGETYLLEGDHIDLEPLVRDAIVLELPTVAHCRDDCAGLCPQCGADLNLTQCDCVADDSDPRWAALGSLEL